MRGINRLFWILGDSNMGDNLACDGRGDCKRTAGECIVRNIQSGEEIVNFLLDRHDSLA